MKKLIAILCLIPCIAFAANLTVNSSGQISGPVSADTFYASNPVSEASYLTNGDRISDVWNALGALTETSGEVAIMTWGDSVSTGKWDPINMRLQQLYGKRGIAFDRFGLTLGGGATSTTDFTRWMSRIFTLAGSGDYIQFTDFVNNGYTPILCNELTVFYVKESGAGNFSVTGDLNESGSFSTVTGFSSIATANATKIGGFTKLAITRGAYRFRVNWVSGTTRILGLRCRDTLTGGIVDIRLGYSGQNLSDMNDCPSAVLNPILAELAPTIEAFEMKDALTNWQTELETHISNVRGAVSGLPMLLIASNPVGGVGQDDAIQIQMNTILKQVAQDNDCSFWNGYGFFGSYSRMVSEGWISDGVHPTNDGYQAAAENLMRNLTWDRRQDRLRVSPKRWVSDVNTALPWVFENRGGQPKLSIRGPVNYFKSFYFENSSGDIIGGAEMIPENAANNAGSLALEAGGSKILVTTDGRVRFGGGINYAAAFTGALNMPSGNLEMNGTIRNTPSLNASPANGDLWPDSTSLNLRTYQNATALSILSSTLTTNAPEAANSIWGVSNGIAFEGATANSFEGTLGVADPTVDWSWNINGNNLTATRVFTPPDVDFSISSFVATVLDDADAATFRTTIGAGNVTGPTSTTDNTLPRFDGTAGALQTSGITVSDSNGVSGATSYNTSNDGAATQPTFARTNTASGMYVSATEIGFSIGGSPGAGVQKFGTDATGFYVGPTASKMRIALGQIQATATNDSASAGNMGEYASSNVASGSAVSLTTATTANVTSISLTAGDWDVDGVVGLTGTGLTATSFQGGISTTTATMGGESNRFDDPLSLSVFTGNVALPTPTVRISISSTTTVYLVANSTFTVGTAGAYGTIRARRVR